MQKKVIEGHFKLRNKGSCSGPTQKKTKVNKAPRVLEAVNSAEFGHTVATTH